MPTSRAGLIAIPKDHEDVAGIVRDLRAAGLPANAITVLGRHPGDEDDVAALARSVEPGTVNAVLGAVVGGALGLLGGIAALSLPGVGPAIVAGGTLAVAAEGTAAAVLGAEIGTTVTRRADLATVAHHEALFHRELAAGRWIVVVAGEPSELDRAGECLAAYQLDLLERI
jgi:hypothetical protein